MQPVTPDESPKQTSRDALSFLATFGPGIALAATGVGAGDVTTTGLGAARMGLGLLWVPVLAVVLKYYINEGMTRYQLVTHRPFVHSWGTEFGPYVRYGFFLYFLGWLIPVFATSIASSGVAMDMLLPLENLDPWFADRVLAGGPRRADAIWSLLLEVVVIFLLLTGGYKWFESSMALCVGLMGFAAIGGAAVLFSTTQWQVNKLIPTTLEEVGLCLAIMAGVGGTVTMMSYGSWIEERGRASTADLQTSRIDLFASYLFTGGFGVCMILIVGGADTEVWSKVLGQALTDQKLELRNTFALIGYRLEHDSILPAALGQAARMIFGVGLLATVLSTLIGLLQSIPVLLIDYFCVVRGFDDTVRARFLDEKSSTYRSLVLLCAIVPCGLVCIRQPAEIVYLYAIYASLFLPCVAATLLVLNNSHQRLGECINTTWTNLMLALCVLMFALAAVVSIWHPY